MRFRFRGLFVGGADPSQLQAALICLGFRPSLVLAIVELEEFGDDRATKGQEEEQKAEAAGFCCSFQQ